MSTPTAGKCQRCGSTKVEVTKYGKAVVWCPCCGTDDSHTPKSKR